jgi:hypothetical protein
MSALAKRIGTFFVVFDLLVGGAAAAVLHHHSTGTRQAAKMAGPRLEHIVSENAAAAQTGSGFVVDTTCSSDPTGGWDYYCVSSDGSRSLYDVSADRITQRSDLPSYR